MLGARGGEFDGYVGAAALERTPMRHARPRSGTRSLLDSCSGHGCTFGPHHAEVDGMDQVSESNENHNTADIDVIC